SVRPPAYRAATPTGRAAGTPAVVARPAAGAARGDRAVACHGTGAVPRQPPGLAEPIAHQRRPRPPGGRRRALGSRARARVRGPARPASGREHAGARAPLVVAGTVAAAHATDLRATVRSTDATAAGGRARELGDRHRAGYGRADACAGSA